jgi:hypothetical protein
MNGWQIAAIVLIAFNFLMGVVLHDTPKTGKHNFSFTLAGTLLWLIILHEGGFFN